MGLNLFNQYELKDGKLIPVDPNNPYSINIEQIKVARTEIDDDVSVSTVLLPMDHNLHFDADKMPKIFETMIFGGEHNGFTGRYPTYNEALKHHNLIVESLKENKPLPKIEISPNWLEDYLRMFDYD